MEKVILDEKEAEKAFYEQLKLSGFPEIRFCIGERDKKPEGPWTKEYPLGVSRKKGEGTWWESSFRRTDGSEYRIYTPLRIPGIVIDPGARGLDEA